MARHANLSAGLLVTGRWQVAVPGWLSGTGRRVRKSFADKTEAMKFAARMRAAAASGKHASAIPTELAMEAIHAARILEGSGIFLQEAARFAVANANADGGGELLEDRHARAVAAGEGVWSAIYARGMGKLLSWLGKGAGKRPCREFTGPEIDRLLRANGAAAASTLAMRRARVLAVLRYRERHRRTRGAVTVTDLAGVLKVMAACETDAQRRVVALLAFAGIRPDTSDGEISRLDWSAVGKTEIYVSPEVSKTKTDRHIPITPALRKWLAGHPAAGPVCPPNWQRAWKAVRKTSGISQHRDILRHTFASHYLAAFGEDDTKMAMGHTAGSDTLFRHYRRAVTAAAGKAYFQRDAGKQSRTRRGAS